MAWDDKAQRAVIELFGAGLPEKAIIDRIRRSYGCDGKTVRRCLAGLSVLRARQHGRETASEKGRFDNYGGTEHYLAGLERAYAAYQRSAAAPGDDHARRAEAVEAYLDFLKLKPSADTYRALLTEDSADVEERYWAAMTRAWREAYEGSDRGTTVFQRFGPRQWHIIRHMVGSNPRLDELQRCYREAVLGGQEYPAAIVRAIRQELYRLLNS